MKESNYNKFFEREDLVIAYNARTNALAEISKEDYNQILQWRDSKKRFATRTRERFKLWRFFNSR